MLIEHLQEVTESGQKFRGLALIKGSKKGTTKKGDPFFDLQLKCQKKEIPTKVWSDLLTSYGEGEVEEILKEGNVVFLEGETSLFRDSLQMTAKFFRVAKPSEYSLGDFLEGPPEPIEELQKEFESYVSLITDPLIKNIITNIYEGNKERFTEFPAATHNHHTFIGGLLYHTVCMLRLGYDIAKRYDSVNLDYIIGAIAIHDAAKVSEYTDAVSPQYTVPGKLIGHITMISLMIDREVQQIRSQREDPFSKLEQEAITQLHHCVLAHHGKKEWGAPQEPSTLEAEIIHHIDMIDSRVNMITRGLEDASEGEVTKIFPVGDYYKPFSN